MEVRIFYMIGIFFICIFSFVFFQRGKIKTSLFLLFLAALLIRVVVGCFDDFLHDWDERFHALVAKNMMDYPFKPMLRVKPILPNYDYTAWCCNHIWLHKQPLFLWQMALSMKVLGVNTLALRLPSIIMGSLLILLTYRIGALVFNVRVGYYAAFVITFAYYQIELISGNIGMDHNDIAFLFYVSCSLWAYFEYLNSPSKRFQWAMLIGLFSGAAILCKWLTGLLVYFGWGVYVLTNLKQIVIKKEISAVLIALFTTAITFLPWQIYIGIFFPKESAYERQFNTQHIFEVVEKHSGTVWFYMHKLSIYYSSGLVAIVLMGVILILGSKNSKKFIFLSYIAIIYFFFSVVVKTKLPSYVYVVSPLIYIMIAYFVDSLLSNITATNKQIVTLAVLLVAAIFTLQPANLNVFNSYSSQRESKIHNTAIYKQLNNLVPSNYVVYNCKSFEDTEAMFFSDRNVYHWWMTEAEYTNLKTSGQKIAVFKSHTNQPLPAYLQNDKEVLIIDKELK